MADGEMRVDELATAAGVATTTVRLYRQRGLLPPPRLVGRTGWYSPAHLERLRLIARLQADGFSLAGIGRLLDAAARGDGLDELVAIGDRVEELRSRRRAVSLTLTELAQRFEGQPLDADSINRAVQLGLVELSVDGTATVPDARFLEVGSQLARLGVGLGTILDEWEVLAGVTAEVADRFVAVFDTQVLGSDWRERADAEVAERAAATLPTLVELAHTVLAAALDAALAEAVDREVGDLLGTVAEATPGDSRASDS